MHTINNINLFLAEVKTTVLSEAEVPLTIHLVVILVTTHDSDLCIRTEQRQNCSLLGIYVD
jgi:hypothetical protein